MSARIGGVIGTNLIYAVLPIGRRRPLRLLAPVLKRPRHGARTPVYLASSEDVEGVSGLYFRDTKPVEPSESARDPALAERLWEETGRLVGLA